MSVTTKLDTHIGWSGRTSAIDAMDEIFDGTDTGSADLGIVFLSSRFDLDEAAGAIKRAFACPVLACTTAGELSKGGYHESGMVAASLKGISASTTYIHDIGGLTSSGACEVASQFEVDPVENKDHRAAILLVDGLSLAEEYASAHLYGALGELPLVGGSAGDDGQFRETHVFDGDCFRSGGAMLSVVESPTPIDLFAHHHYVPTDTRLIVTSADPERRIIHEINGSRAADVYAEALGVGVEELSATTVSTHPLIYRVGKQNYVRGVATVLPNGHMQLFCAIEEGLVLSLGAPGDMAKGLDDLSRQEAFSDAGLILGFDCIQRGGESQLNGCRGELNELYSEVPLIGFSTYGEQYNGLHVNQTLTGLILRNG